ncbi:MAG TPA: phosphotriesterase [Chryseolinea sp.]|nr:phosphotriesterase [Chryseolinea sp.]
MAITNRRKFIGQGSLLFTALLFSVRGARAQDAETVMTVNGPLRPDAMNFTLSHEHVLVDFIGADKTHKDRYNADEVFAIALPFLKDIKQRGCNTFVDCTPAYIGRDALVLQRLATASGLNIITTTGYYGAAKEKYLPEHAYSETSEQLAARWIEEWKNGIEGTGIKPGLIKSGVDNAPLSEVQRKIIDAAALTHLATGLTIGVHTGSGDAANEQLEILERRGVAPSARIWIHAQNEKNKTYHIDAAQRGSWVSFDGVNPSSISENVQFLKEMKGKNLLNAVLVSQDSGWYNVGEPQGGKFNHYNCIFTDFIPELKRNGFSQKDIDAIFIANPAKALTVKVRKLK